MDLPLLRNILSLHKDTLKTLDISYLSPSGQGRLFNVSDFQALEKLRLSRGLMSTHLGCPTSDADALLAPNLKTFGWDFTPCYYNRESWHDFSDKEDTWLRVFLETAAAKRSGLNRVEIKFREWIDDQQIDYPWWRLDAIREDYRSSGLIIQYGPCTREEWDQRRREYAFYEEQEYESRDCELEETELESTVEESTRSESTGSESREKDFSFQKLKDPEPGRDIREFLVPIPIP